MLVAALLDIREVCNKIVIELLSSSLSDFPLEKDFEFDLLFKSFSKKTLFATASNIFESWLLLALEVLSFFS